MVTDLRMPEELESRWQDRCDVALTDSRFRLIQAVAENSSVDFLRKADAYYRLTPEQQERYKLLTRGR